MSLPGVRDLAKQLATNWEAAGSLSTSFDEDEDEEEGELTCLSWLHTSNPHSVSMPPASNIPNIPLPPKLRMKEETGDPMKELLSKKFQIQQKTSVKKLCQHFKILSQVTHVATVDFRINLYDQYDKRIPCPQYKDFSVDETLKPPYSYAALICLAIASTRLI